MKIRWTSLASAELAAALEYIESQRASAGLRLCESIEGVISRLKDFPKSYPPVPGRKSGMRQAPIDPFNYLLTYEIGSTEIVIISLWHARRRRP